MDDLERAIALSLVDVEAEAKRTQEENDLALALELSSKDSDGSRKQEDEDLAFAMAMQLAEQNSSPSNQSTSQPCGQPKSGGLSGSTFSDGFLGVSNLFLEVKIPSSFFKAKPANLTASFKYLPKETY